MGDFVGLPLAAAAPAVGLAFGAGGAYLMRQRDTTMPSSAAGAGGFYSTNGSWLFAVGGRAWLARDRWRATGSLAGFSFTYDFFGVGTSAGDADQSVQLTQPGSAVVVDLAYRVVRDLYVGPRYRYVHLSTDIELDGGPLAIIPNVDDYTGS
jgi:hypothetical protein